MAVTVCSARARSMIASSWVAASLVQSSVTASAGVSGPRCDRVGLPEELPDLGAPGLLALLALVRDQVVVPGNAVHGGGEGIGLEPALMEAVG